jgi:ABC-type antimicrobial peptide transport system permease subunit
MDARYMAKELWYRKRRTMTATIGLAVGLAIFITMNALSSAYSQAARMPLKEIGADITVQRAGNVPENLAGPVFACSAVTIRKNEVDQIRSLPGIRSLAQALLVWVFDTDRFTIVLGFDPSNPVGPGVLRTQLTDGKFLQKGKNQALVEASYAKTYNIRTGDTVTVAGKTYPVAGIVDASRATKIAVANIYLPIEEARKMAAASQQVQAVSPFGPEDANILFIKAAPEQIEPLTHSIKDIVGEKASVATPASFLKRLGSLFALSDKFSLVTSLIAIVVTLLIVLKTMAGNITERTAEIGVLKAIGWSNVNVVSQLAGESILQCLIGGIIGLLIAILSVSLLGFIQVHIPIPWEMSPTPHFLPGGGDPVFKTLRLPVHISWRLAALAILLSTLIGAVTGGLLGRYVARIKPSEILRYE